MEAGAECVELQLDKYSAVVLALANWPTDWLAGWLTVSSLVLTTLTHTQRVVTISIPNGAEPDFRAEVESVARPIGASQARTAD